MVKARSKPPRALTSALPAADGVALRVGDLVIDGGHRAADQPDVAVLLAADAAQPAFDVDFLAGAVHLAVVEHVPAQLVGDRARVPGLVAPGVGRARQDGLVGALAGDQVSWRRSGMGKRGSAICPGGDLLAARLERHHVTPVQRRAVFQGGGPDHHLAVIGEGVQPDLGDLDPGLDGLPVAVRCGSLNQRPGAAQRSR